MTLYRNRKRSDLAAIDGKKFNLDLLMTGISFILLFIFAVIPIAMIAYNAFFYKGQFSLKLFTSVMTNKHNLAAMWNTIKIAFWVTICGTLMGLFMHGC